MLSHFLSPFSPSFLLSRPEFSIGCSLRWRVVTATFDPKRRRRRQATFQKTTSTTTSVETTAFDFNSHEKKWDPIPKRLWEFSIRFFRFFRRKRELSESLAARKKYSSVFWRVRILRSRARKNRIKIEILPKSVKLSAKTKNRRCRKSSGPSFGIELGFGLIGGFSSPEVEPVAGSGTDQSPASRCRRIWTCSELSWS